MCFDIDLLKSRHESRSTERSHQPSGTEPARGRQQSATEQIQVDKMADSLDAGTELIVARPRRSRGRSLKERNPDFVNFSLEGGDSSPFRPPKADLVILFYL